MKKFDTANATNKIAVFLLLAASVTYHVSLVLKAKKEDSGLFSGLDVATSLFHNTVLPSGTNPFFILSK